MIRARNILEVYPQLLDAVQNSGVQSAPRGKPVIEHPTPIGWTLEKPWEWSLMIPGRRLNPFFALAEVVWMWTGKGGVDFISYYNKSMTQFADEGIPYFNGAYGRRVRKAGYSERPFREIPYLVSPNQNAETVEIDQLEHVITKLKNDNDTRQAVVSLWDPVKDNLIVSKDHPCNNMVYFSNRGGALNITVVIRSNDLIWGVPYNMVQFVHLQALIAGALDLRMGLFNVLCNNLHYYTELYPPTLEAVLGWRVAVGENAVKVDKLCDVTYQDINAETMCWNLASFDGFVRNIWEPMEKLLRLGFDNNGTPAYYSSQWEKFKMQMEMNRIPKYWQNVFKVMFMYHIRKAKVWDLYSDIFQTLPPNLRWMINDFDDKVAKEE